MSQLNKFNTDKFQAVFSNIPVPSTRTDKLNLAVFNNFVKSVSLPDYTVELFNSDFQQIVRRNPINKVNADFSPLTVEFVLDEDLENYLAFFEWMKELKCGNSTKGSNFLHESYIKQLAFVMKDNENRNGLKFIFKDVILISLSSINLVFGNSEQVVFTTTFQYNSWDIERNTSTRNN